VQDMGEAGVTPGPLPKATILWWPCRLLPHTRVLSTFILVFAAALFVAHNRDPKTGTTPPPPQEPHEAFKDATPPKEGMGGRAESKEPLLLQAHPHRHQSPRGGELIRSPGLTRQQGRGHVPS
jgi:hypothetical protein